MKRTQLNINIDPNLLKEIKTSARKEGKSLVEYVNDFFKKHLNNDASDDLEIRLINHENQICSNRLWRNGLQTSIRLHRVFEI